MTALYLNNILTGESRPLDVSGDTPEEQYANALKAIEALPGDQHLALSDHPWESPANAPAGGGGAAKILTSPEQLAAADIPAPPIPKPGGVTQIPPERSDTRILATEPTHLEQIRFGNTWIPTSQLNPAFPTDIYAQYSVYWQRAGLATLTGPQKYTKSIAYQTGMSATDSVSMSAELGVAVNGLSAKLSETVGYTITTSEQVTITDSYALTAPEDKTLVYGLWQLMGSILFVGPDKKTPVDWSGRFQLLMASYKAQPRLSQMNVVYSDQTPFDPSA